MRLVIIFITGAAILALQLISSRVMAPYFGVSLYIWSSILSITLLFLALGYAYGGRYTHKKSIVQSAFWYHSASAFSALWITISCMIYPLIFRDLGLWSLLGGSFAACFLLLSGSLFLLSAPNPLLVALRDEKSREDGHKTDSGAGYVFFVSTMGSVAGVLIAAFLIIPFTTNYLAMLLTAAILALTSLISIWFEPNLYACHRKIIAVVGVVVLVVSGYMIATPGKVGFGTINLTETEKWTLLEDVPSAFGTIKVFEVKGGENEDERQVVSRRVMAQNGLIQNMTLANGYSVTLYTYMLEAFGLTAVPNAQSVLVLGHGAGVLPRRFADKGMRVDVVEINPQVYRISKDYFGYKDDRITMHIEDARTFVKKCEKQYDLVIVDLYLGSGLPEHIVSKEFYQDIKNCLTEKGGMAINTIYTDLSTAPHKTFQATISNVFGDVFCIVNIFPGGHWGNAWFAI
ncbi:MAG: fused MFS/spermidine synthase [Proteobacteria bacterium]|nr:fused MFS/spermidine synthase [Pseudomonadota bacterium]